MDNSADLLISISKKMSLLITLQLNDEFKGLSKSDLLAKLSSYGLSNEDLALILGTTKGTVEVLKSRAKGKKVS